MKPSRVSMLDFPDVVLHAEESAVKRHSQFQAAKAGDIVAAGVLAVELVNRESVEFIRYMLDGRSAELVPIHALESEGVNEIPAAFAKVLSRQIAMPSTIRLCSQIRWGIPERVAFTASQIRRSSRDL